MNDFIIGFLVGMLWGVFCMAILAIVIFKVLFGEIEKDLREMREILWKKKQ